MATAPAIDVVDLVVGLLAMVKAPPPATLTWVKSCVARTATWVVPAPTPLMTAPSIKAMVSMSVKLVMIAPAPATENFGGVLAPAVSPPEAAPWDCKSPVTAASGAAAPPSALLCELAEPESALSARPGLEGPPVMAAAMPTAPTLPVVLASTFRSEDRTKPAAPSSVLAPPASASLSPM